MFSIHMRPVLDANSPSILTLLGVVPRDIKTRRLSIRTEQQYVYWVRCFVRHFQRRHPRELGAPEVAAFLATLQRPRRAQRLPVIPTLKQVQARKSRVFVDEAVAEIEVVVRLSLCPVARSTTPALFGQSSTVKPGTGWNSRRFRLSSVMPR